MQCIATAIYSFSITLSLQLLQEWAICKGEWIQSCWSVSSNLDSTRLNQVHNYSYICESICYLYICSSLNIVWVTPASSVAPFFPLSAGFNAALFDQFYTHLMMLCCGDGFNLELNPRLSLIHSPVLFFLIISIDDPCVFLCFCLLISSHVRAPSSPFNWNHLHFDIPTGLETQQPSYHLASMINSTESNI